MMNIESINVFLFASIFTSISFALFIYLGNYTVNVLKTFGGAPSEKNFKGNPRRIERRKTVSKPTITCSMPIHEEKRQEAPFFS